MEEFEYMGEEREVVDFRDEIVEPENEEGGEEFANEYERWLTNFTDTSAVQARKGKDIQGIPWKMLMNISREKYRLTRLEQYKNHENIPGSGKNTDKEYKPVEKGANYYEFSYNTRVVKPTILHFQRHQGSILEGFSQTQISTLAVKDKFLVAGGTQGELFCKHLDRKGVSFCTRTTFDEKANTNAIEIYDNLRGGVNFLASTNDSSVSEYELERYQILNHFCFPWPVNHTSVSPDCKHIAIVGDSQEGLLVDAHSGKVIDKLVGHQDYSFASAWHPNGQIFATGNQDKTCRVWDIRNLSSSVAVLKGNLGAIRSIKFSSDGEFMVMAEPADFVHVYNTKSCYNKRQEMDFFGEISGVSVSPDDESVYIGVWDQMYASLLQYNRKHSYTYLDSFM